MLKMGTRGSGQKSGNLIGVTSEGKNQLHAKSLFDTWMFKSTEKTRKDMESSGRFGQKIVRFMFSLWS